MFIISLGEELSIFCQAHGVPKPKIVWFWNDAPVEDDNDGFRIYGYIVNNFMTQDTSSFTYLFEHFRCHSTGFASEYHAIPAGG